MSHNIFSRFTLFRCMQWTDRIRQVKIVLFVAAIVLAVLSLVVSHYLVRDLYAEERSKMEIWSEAMRTLNKADENTDLNLVLKVINDNNTIPVIVVDKMGQVQTFRNVKIKGCDNYADSLHYASQVARQLFAADRYIKIALDDNANSDDIYVCFDDSVMLKRLTSYPYVQLCVVFVFVVIAIFALLTSKRAEQNKVWVGLSRETAHQLGTPISSLMAWTEVLQELYPEDDTIEYLKQDVERLQLIADRFSKIGSAPKLAPTNVSDAISSAIKYMAKRTSGKAKISYHPPQESMTANLCPPLFAWVIENLCKNAVDAMSGVGSINITAWSFEKHIEIDVTDTGKGIPASRFKSVFRPGYTTKQRGWGLGLSLAKRIIEQYHKGKIFVKQSEINVGTTFTIILPKHHPKPPAK